MVKPIVKWAGGKRQLITKLKQLMPKSYNRYFEPFIGGGALFFELKPENAFINDYNQELTNLYQVVRDCPDALIEALAKHKNESEYYYEIRSIDRDKEKFAKLSNIQKASRFIYLNKTAYNGLHRVNSKGEFNVPFGRYKNPNYCDAENILKCSELLKSTEISNGDFGVIEGKVSQGDFVYFDPPYVPVSKTSSFASYTDQGFDDEMQMRLKKLCDHVHEVGGYFMLSNSHTDYVMELYNNKDYKIHIVEAKRLVNANPANRGKIKEIVVTNY